MLEVEWLGWVIFGWSIDDNCQAEHLLSASRRAAMTTMIVFIAELAGLLIEKKKDGEGSGCLDCREVISIISHGFCDGSWFVMGDGFCDG
jgi:hypothetical protein